jgi:hypothetical protein
MRAEHFDRDLLEQVLMGNITFFQDNGLDLTGGNSGAPFPDYYSLNPDDTRNYIDYGEVMSLEKTAMRLKTYLYFCVPPNATVDPPFTFTPSVDGYKKIMFGWDTDNSKWTSSPPNPDPDTLEVEVKFFVKPFTVPSVYSGLFYFRQPSPRNLILGLQNNRIFLHSGTLAIASSTGTDSYRWDNLINKYVEIGARFQLEWDPGGNHWDLLYYIQWRYWDGIQWNFREGKATLSGIYHGISVSASSTLWGITHFFLIGDSFNRPYGFFRCRQGAGVFSRLRFWNEGGAV